MPKENAMKSMQRGRPDLVLNILIGRDRMGESYGHGRQDLDALEAMRKTGIDPTNIDPPGMPPRYSSDMDSVYADAGSGSKKMDSPGPYRAIDYAEMMGKPRRRIKK